MRKALILALCGLTLSLAACGPNTATRATTGAATGAVLAGPVGAVAGAAVGGSGMVRVNP
ncbi:hypothetical protein [Paracoccus siganidrum]|uniref:Uncharacterized protein n=1 Tax=Paracoccus siganidrum TaxID=1276757 RepID=A0A419AB52_9RHOB|nr:hypothetical protein [Paracoccus siganidrum]RJL20587.1 hypothetical protein D3P05_02925 [Paracoccus siganidrum]RMC38331.1 hypothetical protein C9E82_07765 [Paracoccus siganidrum]